MYFGLCLYNLLLFFSVVLLALKLSMTTLEQLHTAGSDVIRICQQAAPKYVQIGTLLLNDSSGAIMESITLACHQQPENAIRQVFCKWLQQDLKYSWSKLIQCLRECSLNTLAQSITDALKTPVAKRESGMAKCTIPTAVDLHHHFINEIWILLY